MNKKFFLFILIIFYPLKIFSVYILLDSNIIKEGGIIKIKIKSERLLKAAEVHFLEKHFPVFFERYNRIEKLYVYSSIVPVPLDVTGEKNIDILYQIDNENQKKIEKITIKKMMVKKSKINTGILNNEYLADLSKEKKIINDLQNELISAKFSFPFIIPVQGLVSGEFGITREYDKGIARWRHKGIDIAAEKGTPVKATNNGIIAGAYFTKSHGNFVLINHGAGIYSFYSHLNKVYVKKGQYVMKGDIIATVGDTGLATGPHLHWQINVFKIPVNPMEFLNEW